MSPKLHTNAPIATRNPAVTSARQQPIVGDAPWSAQHSKQQLADQEALQQMQAFFSRLQDHLTAVYGAHGAVVRAHMIFDACAARNLDPQILFKEDTEGDSWADTIANLSF